MLQRMPRIVHNIDGEEVQSLIVQQPIHLSDEALEPGEWDAYDLTGDGDMVFCRTFEDPGYF